MYGWEHPTEYWETVEKPQSPRDNVNLNALGFPKRSPHESHCP